MTVSDNIRIQVMSESDNVRPPSPPIKKKKKKKSQKKGNLKRKRNLKKKQKNNEISNKMKTKNVITETMSV